MKVLKQYESEIRALVSDSLLRRGLYSGWNSPGQIPSPADLPNPGIKPRSPSLQADSLLSEPPGEALLDKIIYNILSERCFCLVS